jgi:hypothetical protein
MVREDANAITSTFLRAHPEMADQPDLFIACLYAAGTESALTFQWLQRAYSVFQDVPKDRWIGWVEAHGLPGHPQGLVVGAYAIDIKREGNCLLGSGFGTDNQQLRLEGTTEQQGIVQGTVGSSSMQAKFIGRMTESALCFEYSGNESGRPIQGITWAYTKIQEGSSP